jgi:hypothetical protein
MGIALFEQSNTVTDFDTGEVVHKVSKDKR